ncbi:MAG TPA: RDD family protein [Acidimicrobiales bacterium]|jgi:uncharacterized RDD family membrane protein YckC|nr:RDD family protein [Acidimicrobiales bacterium]
MMRKATGLAQKAWPPIPARRSVIGKNARVNAYQIPADPTAVMGRRIVAWLIDLVIGTVFAFVLFFALADHAETSSSRQASDSCDLVREFGDDPTFCLNLNKDIYATQGGDSVGVILLVAGYWIANRMLLEGATGGSIGKHLVGLRVIKQDDGSIVGIGKAFIRGFVGIVDHIACFLVGLITALASKGHRRVGDMAASTLVVDKSSVGRPPMVPGLTGLATMAQPAGVYPPPPSSTWGTPPAPTTWGAPAPPAPEPWMPPAPAPEPRPGPRPEPTPAEPTPSAWTPPAPPGAPAPPKPAAPQSAPKPEPAPQATPAATSSSGATPGVGAPVWDSARNTYIQWDPALNKWMQWDDATSTWRPIS